MSTFTQILYHIVFSTKFRKTVLLTPNREKLFRYIWGILNKHQCHLYRINGVEDHLHILISLHPSVALADLIKDIKISTGIWIKENKIFPGFSHWQNGYGAFTYSYSQKDTVIKYIINQQEHHKKQNYLSELQDLLIKAGIKFDEKYLS